MSYYKISKKIHTYWSKIRMSLLKNSFQYLGKNLNIDSTVSFEYPEKITCKDNVIICSGCVLNAKSEYKTGIYIGEGSKLKENVCIYTYNGYVKLGKNVHIGQGCIIYGQGGVEFGDHSGIAGLSFVVASNHVFNELDKPFLQQGETNKGIKIGQNVWGGSNVLILDGVNIGNNAIIGAGSVVRKDVPDGAVVLGNPAQIAYIRK
jgi:acetyltransferase-like isoleucine patch superfamily enzyme